MVDSPAPTQRNRRIAWKATPLILALLIAMASSAYATVLGEQVEMALNIRFKIHSGQGLDEYFVGDDFWYDIELENNCTLPVNATFTVKVYNISRGVIMAKDYKKLLNSREKTRLYPNYTREGKQEVYVCFFDSAGTYKIEVISSIPIVFYQRFPDGRYIVQHTVCVFYFDAMPSYEKIWRDRMEIWIQKNEKWIDESRQIAAENRKNAESMFKLTIMMFLATVMNLFLVVWAAPKEKKRPWNLLLYVYLGVLVFLLLIILFGIPV